MTVTANQQLCRSFLSCRLHIWFTDNLMHVAYMHMYTCNIFVISYKYMYITIISYKSNGIWLFRNDFYKDWNSCICIAFRLEYIFIVSKPSFHCTHTRYNLWIRNLLDDSSKTCSLFFPKDFCLFIFLILLYVHGLVPVYLLEIKGRSEKRRVEFSWD